MNTTTRSGNHTHSANPPGGNTGGASDNHSHGYDSGTSGARMTAGHSNDHVHGFDPGSFTTGGGGVDDRYGTDTGSAGGHSHSVDVGAFTTGNAGSWPPYIQVVYCKKDPTRRAISLKTENRMLRNRVETLEARLSRLEGLLQDRER